MWVNLRCFWVKCWIAPDHHSLPLYCKAKRPTNRNLEWTSASRKSTTGGLTARVWKGNGKSKSLSPYLFRAGGCGPSYVCMLMWSHYMGSKHANMSAVPERATTQHATPLPVSYRFRSVWANMHPTALQSHPHCVHTLWHTLSLNAPPAVHTVMIKKKKKDLVGPFKQVLMEGNVTLTRAEPKLTNLTSPTSPFSMLAPRISEPGFGFLHHFV